MVSLSTLKIGQTFKVTIQLCQKVKINCIYVKGEPSALPGSSYVYLVRMNIEMGIIFLGDWMIEDLIGPKSRSLTYRNEAMVELGV